MKFKPLSTFATAALLSLVPVTVRATPPDLDGDGIPNIVDPDIDNDGVPNALDRNVDGGIARSGPYSGRYIGDHLDNDSPAEKDIDDDGEKDDSLADRDIDGDGLADDSPLETDIDGDHRADDSTAERDIDGDARNNDDSAEVDIDGDGFDDDDDSEMDIDGDSRDDSSDADIDGDSRDNGDSTEDDTDGDGRSDEASDESDDDGDGTMDRDDEDDDNDGVQDNDDGDHHNETDEAEVEVTLDRAAAAPSGSRSRVKIQKMATGKVELQVDARDVPAGAYDVAINGTSIGQLTVLADGNDTRGEQEWETAANKPEEINLTVEVIGQPITVSLNGVVYFSGTVPTPPPPDAGGGEGGGEDDGSGTATVNFAAAPGAPAGAKIKAQLEFGAAGLKSMEVEAEDLPDGSYDFATGGEQRATLTVSNQKGQLKFYVEPEGGEIALDFTAAGETATISQDGTVLYSVQLPASP